MPRGSERDSRFHVCAGRVVEGRTHRLSLEPDVLSVAADWMDRQRALWERLFDVVDEYLKEEAPK